MEPIENRHSYSGWFHALKIVDSIVPTKIDDEVRSARKIKHSSPKQDFIILSLTNLTRIIKTQIKMELVYSCWELNEEF